VLVQQGERSLLIDTGPDLREQLISAGTASIDAVLYTHTHADHCHGIDDLRHVCRLRGAPVDVFGTRETLDELQGRFAYAFTAIKRGAGFYRPQLRPHPVTGPFKAAGFGVIPFVQDHGFGMQTLGFRIGAFAYSTDVHHLPPEAFEALAGIDTWIVDCVQEAPLPTHSHLSQTLEWIEKVGCRRAFLTHMNHQADYATMKAKCPAHVEPAYDGLVVTLPSESTAPPG
jgi:phosphoribosyl 1,2-cyclic phosphate phosphodiesterase